MITIDYCSDLHMEINSNVQDHVKPVDQTGDILILAGDITCYRFFNPKRTDNEARSMRKRFARFINSQPHEHILWLPGNHEYYGTQFHGMVEYIKELCESYDPRLKAINNEVFMFKDLNLYCCTFWTDMDRYNPIAMMSVGDFMRDFQVIGNGKKKLFTPDDAYTEHMKSMEMIKNAYEDRGDQKFVVASHHGPSMQSHSYARFGDSDVKYGYLSEYGDWIADTDILAWIHGHTHHNVDYRINETLITSAMYGYLGHDRPLSDKKMPFGRIYV